LGKLKYGDREDAEAILHLLDQAEATLNTMKEKGVKLPAEEVRFESLGSQLESKQARLLQKLGGAKALSALREARDPDAAKWWWYLDHKIASERRARWRRIGTWSVLGLIAFALLVFGYERFLAPDPAVRRAYGHQKNAETLAEQGDYAEALAEVNRALAETPEEPYLLTIQGVCHQMLGETEAAEESFAAAQAAYESQELFLRVRAQVYLRINRPDELEADANALLALEPDSPHAHFYLGLVNEVRQDYQTAQSHYEKASELAQAADETELHVMANMQLSQVMNKMASAPTLTPTAITGP
jgi:tetratricopeptide (TPR) repeat protein